MRRIGEVVEKPGSLCTIGGNVNGAAVVENGTEIAHNTKARTTIWTEQSHICEPLAGISGWVLLQADMWVLQGKNTGYYKPHPFSISI